MLKNNLLLAALLLIIAGCMPLPSIDDPDSDTDVPGQEDNYVYPTAYYPFERSAEDASGNGYHGVLMGEPEFISDTPDGSSYALKLNGFKKQFVNIPYHILGNKKQYTVLFWIKDFTQGVVFSSNDNSKSSLGYCTPRLRVTDSQQFEFFTNYDYYWNPVDFSFIYDCTSIMSSAWHHIAVTSDNGVNTIYVDGVRRDSMETFSKLSRGTKLYIGGNLDGLQDIFISMKIDDFLIYDICFTEENVRTFYQN